MPKHQPAKKPRRGSMFNVTIFRNWLISFRREGDLTLYDVSKLTGIAVSRLSEIENGKLQNPSLRYFLAFAQGLGYRRLSDFIAEVEG